MSDTRCYGLVNYPEVKDADDHAVATMGNLAETAVHILSWLDEMEPGEVATLIIRRDDWLRMKQEREGQE